MQLILAIDSDPRRTEQLKTLVQARFTVDLVQATSAGEGLHALKDRVPDLILTAPLLSPFDDGVLDEYLRDLGTAATHVQTVRIPMLSAPPKKKSTATRLFGLGRKKTPTSSAAPDGCDPKLFADEIAHYLTRSLEERSVSAKAGSQSDPTKTALAQPPAQDRISQRDMMAQPVEEFVRPDALIEEFTAPIAEDRAPIYTPPVFEEVSVPGAILGLRPTQVVETRKPQIVVEPETLVVGPELQAFVKPAVQAFVEPAVQAFVEPEPMVIVEPEVPAIVEPVAAASVPHAVSAPAAPETPAGTSPSFEAALAAIRAAWVKPEGTKPASVVSVPPSDPTHSNPKPPVAGAAEVDLTNQIDALEDVVGADGLAPAADDEHSPDESKTPAERRKVDKARKRPEKARGRRLKGPDGTDDLGVFDPNQCGFSTLVNTLDEVTEDEVTERSTPTVR